MAELSPEWRATLLKAMHILHFNGTEDRLKWSPELADLFDRAATLVGLVLDMAAEEEAAEKKIAPAMKMIEDEYDK